MVARILLNGRALNNILAINHKQRSLVINHSVQEPKRFIQSLPEGSIITSIRQRNRYNLNSLARKVIHKDILRHLRALGRLGSIGAAVCVSDAKVTLRNHVEVEVHKEIVDVLDGQIRRVEFAAEEAFFFGTPPGEADPIFGLVL
jgi:hypothetical protein